MLSYSLRLHSRTDASYLRRESILQYELVAQNDVEAVSATSKAATPVLDELKFVIFTPPATALETPSSVPASFHATDKCFEH